MKALMLVLVGLMIAGCGATRESADVPDDPNARLRQFESDFRPSDYDPEPAPGTPPTQERPDQREAANTEETPTVAFQEEVQGYRVQVYSTTSIDSAKVKKLECESLFPGERFYLDYDPPTYKIRAGNFLTKYPADRFARQLAAHGYPDAWPVPQRVYKDPPAPPIRTP